MNRFVSSLGAVALLAVTTAASPVVTVDKIPAAAHPYDEAADGRETIAAALATAKAEHKKLLIDFGANWCPDCRALAGILGNEQVHAYVAAHYEVSVVDVARFNKNLDLARHYGVKLHGIPTVMVVDPSSDEVMNRDGVEALSDAATMSPQAVVDQLAAWTEHPAS